MGKLKTKTEGLPSAGINIVATWGSALKMRMDYRLSVIRDAPDKYGQLDYIIAWVMKDVGFE